MEKVRGKKRLSFFILLLTLLLGVSGGAFFAGRDRYIENDSPLLRETSSYSSPVDSVAETVNLEKKVTGGEASPDPEAGEEEAVEEPEKKGIKTLVNLNFRNTDLSEALLCLSELSGLAIATDEKALKGLKNPGVSLYTPAAIPLTDALDLLLKVKGLDYVIEDDYIWVTKKEQTKPVTRVYQLKYGIRKVQPEEFSSLVKE